MILTGWTGFPDWVGFLPPVDTHQPLAGCEDRQTKQRNDDTEG